MGTEKRRVILFVSCVLVSVLAHNTQLGYIWSHFSNNATPAPCAWRYLCRTAGFEAVTRVSPGGERSETTALMRPESKGQSILTRTSPTQTGKLC